MRAGWQHVLGLCGKGTCLQMLHCAVGVLSAGRQVGTCQSRNGKNVLGKGPAEHGPSPQERKMLYSQVEEGRTQGLVLFSGDMVSCCSGLGGREEGRPAAQGRSGLVWCSCEPQPLWSWGLSKGRSRSRTGNPAAGSGCAGSGSVPAVQWPKAIAGDHITEPVPLGGVNTDDISGEQRCGKLLQSP